MIELLILAVVLGLAALAGFFWPIDPDADDEGGSD